MLEMERELSEQRLEKALWQTLRAQARAALQHIAYHLYDNVQSIGVGVRLTGKRQLSSVRAAGCRGPKSAGRLPSTIVQHMHTAYPVPSHSAVECFCHKLLTSTLPLQARTQPKLKSPSTADGAAAAVPPLPVPPPAAVHLTMGGHMPAHKLTSSLAEVLSMSKEIDTDDQDMQESTKVVKLRFTRKQYQAFRDACKILEAVAMDSKLNDFVKSALGADVKVSTINKQIVQPILEAPLRISMKVPRAAKEGEQKKESYFTMPVAATDQCLQLYSKVKNEGIVPKQDVLEGTTCVTDVRVMMSRYIFMENLRNEHGVMLDDFILELVPKSLHEHVDQLHRVDGDLVIPKGNRKVMTAIVNEITLGQ